MDDCKKERAAQLPAHTMKNIPPTERPYEKCLEMGAASLSDSELLGIELLDHIIIGDCQAVSLREKGIWHNASS